MEVKTRSRKVAEVRAKITMAARKVVRATHATGPLYAELALAVGAGEKAGLTRAMISKTIRAELESEKRRRLVKHTNGKVEEHVKVHKGGAARYVMIWRWHTGKFLKGERKVTVVEIEGHRYRSPIAALQSGRHSFTLVFHSWREATRPPVTDLSAVPTEPREAAARLVRRLTFPLLVKQNGRETVTRVKVLESAEALASVLDALHASPLAAQANQLRSLLKREVVRRPTEPRRRRPVARLKAAA